MTACFKLMRTLQQNTRPVPASLCSSCVYFAKNLDPAEYPDKTERLDQCGLGYVPGDSGCAEMRTDNCSMRKR